MQTRAYQGFGPALDGQNRADFSACYCISMGVSLDLSQKGRGFAALFGMQGDTTCA